jgi:transposase InsO family protein
MARHGGPRHIVSDQGDEFTASVFRETLKALGIRQRFGAIGQHGSIALIERFFRSLKADLRGGWLRLWHPRDLARRLELALARYAYCRPHLGLGGRVPAEVYFGLTDQRPLLNSAPRGRPEGPEADCPFEVLFLDPETETLPILVPRVA